MSDQKRIPRPATGGDFVRTADGLRPRNQVRPPLKAPESPTPKKKES